MQNIENENMDIKTMINNSEDETLKLIADFQNIENFDKRWLSIAKTNIEQGFMALRRATFNGKRIEDK